VVEAMAVEEDEVLVILKAYLKVEVV